MKAEADVSYIDQIEIASQYLNSIFSMSPEIGIILGTGLGQLIKHIDIRMEIPYDAIPYFPLSTVESHHGKMVLGSLAGKSVVAMQGRFHYYEGYSMQQVTFPVRVLKKLGIAHLLVSNAAGGLHPDFEVGDLMIIQDHIDLLPENPLRGKNLDQFGVRFPDMSEPYDLDLVKKALEISLENGVRARPGVYVAVQGPNLETKAEYKYLRTIGADAVGMSTVPEVIVARHMNLPVFAVSAITDLCSPGKVKKISLAEVLEGAAKAEPGMSLLMIELIKGLK